MEKVIGEQERAYASIKSLRYKLVQEVQQASAPDFPIGQEVTRTVAQRGKWCAVAYHVKHIFADGGIKENTRRAVLNDSYFADSINGAGPDLYVHEGIDRMAKNAVDAYRNTVGPQPLKYGFGDGVIGLVDFYRDSPAQAAWNYGLSRDAANDGETYLISYYRPDIMKDRADPFHVWQINIEQGFLATEIRKCRPDGGLGSVVRVTPQEHGGNPPIWLPGRVEENTFSAKDGKSTMRLPIERNICRFTEVEINPQIPDATFTLAHLGCEDGAIVSKVAADGTSQPMAIVNNEAMPMEVAARILSGRKR